MPIVLISECLLRRSTVADGRILRDRLICGFCGRMNARKRSLKVVTEQAIDAYAEHHTVYRKNRCNFSTEHQIGTSNCR
jgi:hypothetical protein